MLLSFSKHLFSLEAKLSHPARLPPAGPFDPQNSLTVDGGRLSESWGLGPVELKSHLLG